jgi:hypothetical protein
MLYEKSVGLGACPLVEKARALVERSRASKEDSHQALGRLPRDMHNDDTTPPSVRLNDTQVLEDFECQMDGVLQLLLLTTEELQTRLCTLRADIEQLRFKHGEMLAWSEPTDNFLGSSVYELARDFYHVEARVAARARAAVIELSRNGTATVPGHDAS